MGKRFWFFLTIFMALGLFSACSAASPAAMAPSAAPMPAAREYPASEASAADSASADFQRKVIARASLSLVVSDASASMDAIQSVADEMGGYVESVNLYKSGYDSSQAMSGSTTVRIPAQKLEEALARFEALAVDVQSRSLNREDVTSQYTDLDAQLTNLKAAEEELRALLSEVRQRPAATAEDILAVYRQLTDIRGQIEQYQGQKNMLDNLIGLATVQIDLTPDALTQPIVDEGWQPTGVARSALRGLVTMLQWIGNAGIWLVVFFLPLALLALIPVGILAWFVRWLKRRSDAAKAGK
ncbi:MAG: DUF4349 domain-containing protein [Caldilineaceae bacterium]|nr:DUF4349 domain-containing protein [Caldilineaceae bacterium]MBP8106308.1 DUF4349 domain-containing protein [Caldilineaceae bacterium]MBP8123559.1 DUF4349 domain-containing protein [Caldilineaceae bacterium]MBP9071136.1 DUF4349 domain-containing protein [Caldilineaceae bacterium]